MSNKVPRLNKQQHEELMNHVREAYKQKRNDEVKRDRTSTWLVTGLTFVSLLVYHLIRRALDE